MDREATGPAPGPGFRLLPLWLMTGMVALGAAIEVVRFGALDWAPKLPLALLLALAFARARARAGRR